MWWARLADYWTDTVGSMCKRPHWQFQRMLIRFTVVSVYLVLSANVWVLHLWVSLYGTEGMNLGRHDWPLLLEPRSRFYSWIMLMLMHNDAWCLLDTMFKLGRMLCRCLKWCKCRVKKKNLLDTHFNADHYTKLCFFFLVAMRYVMRTAVRL